MIKTFSLALLTLLGAQSMYGYALENLAWTLDRTVNMQLSLGPPRTLRDGFTSFNKSAEDVLNIWNRASCSSHDQERAGFAGGAGGRR